MFVGFGARAGWGASGSVQAGIEAADQVVRLGANVLSFARLAAFGLTHAAIGWVVWTGVTALWGSGPLAAVAAVVVFVLGNAVAMGLGVLVVAVQALRLEYYELFSRVFSYEGVPFRPWHLPVTKEASS
jgi:V/A-type H+-transporting ATPase subunit I